MNLRESIEHQGAVITAIQYVRWLARSAEGHKTVTLTEEHVEALMELSDELEGDLAPEEEA